MAALWPLLASQVDELAKLAGEIADTVAELENTTKGAEQMHSQADPQPDAITHLIAALRSSRN